MPSARIDLGIALRRIRQHLPLRARIHRRLGRAARHPFGQQRHGDDRHGAEQRGRCRSGMEQKQPDQKDRNPGHVEERRRPHARHEGADLVEIAQRLLHQHRLHAAKRQRGERSMDRFLQADVEQGGDPAQHPRAQRLEISLHQIGEQHHQRQAEQGCDIAARNHAVIDLQHIERAGQHQNIDHAAEYGDADHAPRAVAQRKRDGIIGVQRRKQAGNCAGGACACPALSDTH